jgi:hypothetical protein
MAPCPGPAEVASNSASAQLTHPAVTVLELGFAPHVLCYPPDSQYGLSQVKTVKLQELLYQPWDVNIALGICVQLAHTPPDALAHPSLYFPTSHVSHTLTGQELLKYPWPEKKELAVLVGGGCTKMIRTGRSVTVFN